jgi:hypothetical protein
MAHLEPKRTHPFITTPDELSSVDIDRMHAIMCEHFEGVNRRIFEKDLYEKNWIIRIDDVQGKIQGFSTLQHMVAEYQGERIHAFFSGDTVLAKAYMSESSWMSVWIRHAIQQASLLAPEKVYWLLTTATHRTYRILPSCFKRYIPDVNSPPAPDIREIMGIFARQKFGNEFQPETDTVVLVNAVPYRYAEEVEAAGGEQHAANRFFRQKNPGYLRGDFLCCLAEISVGNLRPLGLKILNQKLPT